MLRDQMLEMGPADYTAVRACTNTTMPDEIKSKRLRPIGCSTAGAPRQSSMVRGATQLQRRSHPGRKAWVMGVDVPLVRRIYAASLPTIVAPTRVFDKAVKRHTPVVAAESYRRRPGRLDNHSTCRAATREAGISSRAALPNARGWISPDPRILLVLTSRRQHSILSTRRSHSHSSYGLARVLKCLAHPTEARYAQATTPALSQRFCEIPDRVAPLRALASGLLARGFPLAPGPLLHRPLAALLRHHVGPLAASVTTTTSTHSSIATVTA